MSPMHRRQHGFADDKPDRAAIEKEIIDITTVTKRNTYRLGELWIQVMKHEFWKDAGSHSPQEYLTQFQLSFLMFRRTVTRRSSGQGSTSTVELSAVWVHLSQVFVGPVVWPFLPYVVKPVDEFVEFEVSFAIVPHFIFKTQ